MGLEGVSCSVYLCIDCKIIQEARRSNPLQENLFFLSVTDV